jgi:hypothetical protein
MTDYEALTKMGHSPFKSAEILLDAKRGDQHAIGWIKIVRDAIKLSAICVLDGD